MTTPKKPIDKTAIIVASIISIPGLLGCWLAYENSGAIQNVHLLMNSKLDLLVKTVGEAERAKGVVEGKAEQKAIEK